MRLYLTIILAGICMILHAERGNSMAIINEMITDTSKASIINEYNHIITNRYLSSQTLKCSFESVRSSLKENEIAIEIFVQPQTNGNPEYMALTVRKNYDAPHLIKLFTEKELDQELQKGETIFTDTTFSALLLAPLYNELKDILSIYITPAGKLHLLPLEYCNVKDGIMLCEKYSLFRLTSSAMLISRKEKRDLYKSYTIYGGIDFDLLPEFEEKYDKEKARSPYGFLQDSYQAAINVHNTLTNKGLHGQLYANEMATETSFKALQSQDIQLLFIETHSIAFHQQEKQEFPNALLFAGVSYIIEGGIVPEGEEDGLLTLQEIATLDLSSVDLAVISACSSATGKIDEQGVNGLLRAFKTAGVNSLVMTTNDVLDYVAGEVWKIFFRNIANGMTKRMSLLNAIKEVKALHDGFYNSPIHWSSYILIDGID